jgi:poly-gamma-glutamate capsule biosynthesis protein CapA/YwtB (metallophosphatase superfamily)
VAAGAARSALPVALIAAAACARVPAERDRPRPARLWIGGDVFLGAAPEGRLAAIRELERGRTGVVNLEGPIGEPAVAEGGRLIQRPSVLAELAGAGVRVALIANNHAGDAGPEGAARTAAAVREAGLLPAGAAVLELDGWRIAVTAHDLQAGVPDGLAAELAAARARADALVATFHVTGPPRYQPAPELASAVEIALGAGANAIAAEGTHALSKVERRGPAVIAWGLGNLAFACDCTDEEDGALLEVDLDGRGAGAAAVVPVEAGLMGRPAAPAPDAPAVYELLERIGSSPLRPEGPRAWF